VMSIEVGFFYPFHDTEVESWTSLLKVLLILFFLSTPHRGLHTAEDHCPYPNTYPDSKYIYMFVVSSSSALLSSERYLLDLDDDDERRMCSSTKSKKIMSWIAYIWRGITVHIQMISGCIYICSSFRHSSSALLSSEDIFLMMMMMMRGQQLIRRLTMRGGCVRAQNLRRSGRVPISGSYIIRACSTESLKKEVRACFVFVR
jgi:hypothetical protein